MGSNAGRIRFINCERKSRLKLILYTLLFFSKINLVYAIECNWWQFKVREHSVRQHQRNGHVISKHERVEHCKERWPRADLYSPYLSNSKPSQWPFNEHFKPWTYLQAEIISKELDKISKLINLKLITFHRASSSIIKGNPSTTNIINNQIIIYDSFFTKKDKNRILIHELGHIIYTNLAAQDKDEFEKSSGWHLDIINGKVFNIPPTNPIISDSKTSPDEDFANYYELFFINPKLVEKHNNKVFIFLNQRFK